MYHLELKTSYFSIADSTGLPKKIESQEIHDKENSQPTIVLLEITRLEECDFIQELSNQKSAINLFKLPHRKKRALIYLENCV